MKTVLAAVIVATVATPMLQKAGESPRAILDAAIADFLAARVAESVAGFDRVVALAPDVAPQLWQRGIALYYVGRYDDCRRQFESHRTVNPNDVENPAWHFLCVARAESPEKARAALLPVGPDQRSPMREIYQMFQGTASARRCSCGRSVHVGGAVLRGVVRWSVLRGDGEHCAGAEAPRGGDGGKVRCRWWLHAPRGRVASATRPALTQGLPRLTAFVVAAISYQLSALSNLRNRPKAES